MVEGVNFLAEVRVIDDQIEKALKILKRKLAQDGTFKEVKRRRFYEKPSVKKKRKRQEAQKRRIKALKKSRAPREYDAAAIVGILLLRGDRLVPALLLNRGTAGMTE